MSTLTKHCNLTHDTSATMVFRKYGVENIQKGLNVGKHLLFVGNSPPPLFIAFIDYVECKYANVSPWLRARKDMDATWQPTNLCCNLTKPRVPMRLQGQVADRDRQCQTTLSSGKKNQTRKIKTRIFHRYLHYRWVRGYGSHNRICLQMNHPRSGQPNILSQVSL